MQNSTRLILSPGFMIGLCLLLLNDFVLKAQYGNFLTGKLSDVAGLFVFPFFISIFVLSKKRFVYVITGLAFVLWKSPISQEVIDLANSFQIVRIGRTIDYSDLIALLVLPCSYYYLTAVAKAKLIFLPSLKQFLTTIVSIVSVFAFTATSFEEDRNVRLDKTYTFAMTRIEFEQKLRANKWLSDIEIEKTTDVYPADKYPKVETRPNEYYLRFKIGEKYCESPEARIFTTFQDHITSVTMGSVYVRFWCPEKPTEATKLELIRIFERTVYYPSVDQATQ